jgi:hypothetical protein
VAVYETDFILSRPIRPLFERMHKSGVKVASLGLANPYSFPEWGILFLDVKYAIETDFIKRYDWEHAPYWPLIEMRLEEMFGDDLFYFNIRGMRNDHNQLNTGNLANHFPYRNCEWLTHCADMNLYARMLQLNGVHPTAPGR